jgi:putative flippase GtrA
MSTATRITKPPPRDSFAVLRFGAASLVSAVVDNVIFYLVFRASGFIALAQLTARCFSVLFNYALVRSSVFRSIQPHGFLLPRYLALVTLNALLSYAGIRLITASSHISVPIAKMLAETLLFLFNFALQRAWVFRHDAVPPQP